jgi:hypothetical protein
MSYYADLTPYNYHHYSEKEFNIGWLQKDQDFPKGEVPEGFLDKLKKYSEFKMFQTKGWHNCDFCEENAHGSNEIRVVSKDIKIYACPMLIIHYIEAHKYLPPQEFIDAVMTGPEPGTDDYKEEIAIMPVHWERRKPDMNDSDYEEKVQKLMVEKMSESIDSEIMKDLLEKNPGFKTFVEGYAKSMPAVYGFNKGSEEKNDDIEKS